MKELLNKIHHADCLTFMQQLPDKCIDLVLTDPPYGTLGCGARKGGKAFGKYNDNIENWDFAPDQSYFDEIFRISKNQIIWGGNYFNLAPTRCFYIWKKLTISENFSLAMAEYAWTNFNKNAKLYECAPQDLERFHPTQKPLKLFKWCIKNSGLEKGIVLDCFSGSGTTALACHDLDLDFICVEKDADYYKASVERLEKHKQQLKLF